MRDIRLFIKNAYFFLNLQEYLKQKNAKNVKIDEKSSSLKNENGFCPNICICIVVHFVGDGVH